ncbi:uncharacterized protein LOC121013185 [Herpailurus yagouaroundi]|uniref:uncharacterized protein LOC121013185 n=1 Tax=Herpailurus yagouaroundi TaxID=1608482 RepID=UPI001AD76832|nr:uncharacterized protein LOC121013185 [Puma yagouaroundi]
MPLPGPVQGGPAPRRVCGVDTQRCGSARGAHPHVSGGRSEGVATRLQVARVQPPPVHSGRKMLAVPACGRDPSGSLCTGPPPPPVDGQTRCTAFWEPLTQGHGHLSRHRPQLPLDRSAAPAAHDPGGLSVRAPSLESQRHVDARSLRGLRSPRGGWAIPRSQDADSECSWPCPPKTELSVPSPSRGQPPPGWSGVVGGGGARQQAGGLCPRRKAGLALRPGRLPTPGGGPCLPSRDLSGRWEQVRCERGGNRP